MKHLLFCCCVLWVLAGCKEKYEPPVKSTGLGYLVMEGYFSPTGNAELRLSRTIPLSDTARMVTENSAQVMVEGNDGSQFPLAQTAPGIYTSNQLHLNNSVQYRLFITAAGKEYASDFVPVRPAPAIDSITWALEDDGMRIYINTHDPQNNTWYYRWETEETWEFRSVAPAVLKHTINPATNEIMGVEYRNPDQSPDYSIYTCWQHEFSKQILLGSSEKLSEDRIRLPLVYIPGRSWKLGVLYSINIKQYALTNAEYDYLQIMKRNSEETGSIFDPQPSNLRGNIRCLSDSREPVIGFFSIAERMEKRIFIKSSEVPGWNYFMYCTSAEIETDSAAFYPHMAPIGPYKINDRGEITEFTASEYPCVDCTLRGTNVKPLFWP